MPECYSHVYQCDAKACFRNMVESLEMERKELGFLIISYKHDTIYFSNPFFWDKILVVIHGHFIHTNATISTKEGQQFLHLVDQFFE